MAGCTERNAEAEDCLAYRIDTEQEGFSVIDQVSFHRLPQAHLSLSLGISPVMHIILFPKSGVESTAISQCDPLCTNLL